MLAGSHPNGYLVKTKNKCRRKSARFFLFFFRVCFFSFKIYHVLVRDHGKRGTFVVLSTNMLLLVPRVELSGRVRVSIHPKTAVLEPLLSFLLLLPLFLVCFRSTAVIPYNNVITKKLVSYVCPTWRPSLFVRVPSLLSIFYFVHAFNCDAL